MFGKTQRVRMGIKAVGIEKMEGVLKNLMLNPSQNPGVESTVTCIIEGVQGVKTKRVKLDKGKDGE